MHRITEYSALFIAVVLLQFFLFNSLNLGVFVNPLIYIAFIILLPFNTSAFLTLMLSLLMGIFMDLMMGTYGINTIACLFTGFIRPLIISIIIGTNEAKDITGTPSAVKIGKGKFLKFSSLIVALHCLIYFSFETSNFTYYHLTLLRTVISSLISIGLIYFCQYIFASRR